MLWEQALGGPIQNSTITYAVNGKQYVAVLTGEGLTAGSSTRRGSSRTGYNALYVFALPARTAPGYGRDSALSRRIRSGITPPGSHRLDCPRSETQPACSLRWQRGTRNDQSAAISEVLIDPVSVRVGRGGALLGALVAGAVVSAQRASATMVTAATSSWLR